jgi:hypothetical protein
MKINGKIGMGLVCLSLIVLAFFSACNKESSNGSVTVPEGMQKVTVSLNDDPLPNLASVIVDIRYVEVKVDTSGGHHDDRYYDDDHEGDEDHHEGENDHHEGDDNGHHGDHFGKWDTLAIAPGKYDLLKLKNGADTLIANSFSHKGKITKIRITLGTDNSVSTDSTHSFPLPICSGSPYVYANIRSTSIDSLGGGQFAIHVDFNVARSIVFEDGQFCLRPRIKTYCHSHSGGIEGKVLPSEAKASVLIYNSTDTANALPEREGEFEVRGLTAGTYSVLFRATAPYKDTTLSNINVQDGQETKLPDITLHH